MDLAIQQTLQFWRTHHLGHDQTKSVVERVRRRLALEPAYSRKRTVSRLDESEVEPLVQTTYRRTAVVGGCAFDGLDFAEISGFARLRPPVVCVRLAHRHWSPLLPPAFWLLLATRGLSALS